MSSLVTVATCVFVIACDLREKRHENIEAIVWPVKIPYNLRQVSNNMDKRSFKPAEQGIFIMFFCKLFLKSYPNSNINDKLIVNSLYQKKNSCWRMCSPSPQLCCFMQYILILQVPLCVYTRYWPPLSKFIQKVSGCSLSCMVKTNFSKTFSEKLCRVQKQPLEISSVVSQHLFTL